MLTATKVLPTTATFLLGRCSEVCRHSLRRQSSAYDSPGKTTVNVLNQEVSYLMVDSYSKRGFRLNNKMRAFGPIALFPTCVLSWNIRGVHDISARTLSLFGLIHPRPDVIIIGVGDAGVQMDGQTFLQLRKSGFNLECLPTEDAIAAYNFLCAENRAVGAGLIPPDMLRKLNDSDHFEMYRGSSTDMYKDSNENYMLGTNKVKDKDNW